MLYFVHSVAGTMVAMMHKLGMYRLRINYGTKAVSDYLFNYECDGLACLVDDVDTPNQVFFCYASLLWGMYDWGKPT